MTSTTKSMIAAVIFAHGLLGCNKASSPVAPSPPPVQAPPSLNAETYTLTASASAVSPGAVLSVSWTAPGRGLRDWIGLYRRGDVDCHHGWSESTGGGLSGTLTLTAPIQLGQYEFRYHLNNGCEVVAQSGLVIVTPGA